MPAGEPGRAKAGFLTREGAKLLIRGKEYRAIGVNVPHLHQAYFGTWLHIPQLYGTPEKAKQAIVDAISDAEKSGIPFVRFFASPGYPRDIDMLYAKNPAQYWQLMDELFALCREHHVRLIPSLGTIPVWHLYYGETGQAILDRDSKTHKGVYQYIHDFVTRYRDDPTILMWELMNEGMLWADVAMEGRRLPPGALYSAGAAYREKGVMEDSLTWAMTRRLYQEQAAFIKRLDPNHLITSGDANVRPECTSRRDTFPRFKFRNDTHKEHVANLLAAQEGLDVYSLHIQGNFTAECKHADKTSATDCARADIRAIISAGHPVFIGELGQAQPHFRQDPKAAWCRAFVDILEEERVSLVALWAWHFPWHDKTSNIPDSRAHPELMDRIRQFNEKHAQSGRD
jgi:hypothetical protein